MKKFIILCLAVLMLWGCSAKKENETATEEIKPEKIELLVAYDNSGDTVSTAVYYDGEELKTVKLSNPNEISYYRRYQYDENAMYTLQEEYDSDMKLVNVRNWEYIGGQISYFVSKDGEGNVLRESTSQVENGLVVRKDTVSEDEHRVSLYSYDDNNRMVRIEEGTVDEDGEITIHNYQIIEGNKEGETVFYNDLDDDSYSRTIYVEYHGNEYNYLMEAYKQNEELDYSVEIATYDNMVQKLVLIKNADGSIDHEIRYDEYGAAVYSNCGDHIYEAE